MAINFPIEAIRRKKPENVRASTGFEPVFIFVQQLLIIL